MRPVALVPVLGLVLASCTTASKSTYDSADVGRMIETSEGTIVSSRIVHIDEKPTGVGTAAGAALGATSAGFGIGSGKGSVIAALIGGLAGAGVGYLTEQGMRSREGIEYMVRTPDGRTRTLVQNRENGEEPIPAGRQVLIQYAGTYTRVIEKPPGATDDAWRDPDAAPAAGAAAAGSSGGTPGGATPTPGGGWTSSGGYSGDPGRAGTIRPRQQ